MNFSIRSHRYSTVQPERLNKVFLLLFISAFPLFTSCQSQEHLQVYPGAYALEKYLPLLHNKKVGLVSNQTSLIANTHLVDTLVSLHVNVRVVFTPEHGFKGMADAGELVHKQDAFKQIDVVSLYGSSRKPTPDDLKKTDIVVFDLQDVGARFFTYISTLHYVMEACAENNIPFIVLDRPNPHIHYVDGPMLKEKFKSFVGMHPVPVVYGMTIGEYAQMINGQKWLKDGVRSDLTIIPCVNYHRNSYYELPVKPSPNLPTQRSVIIYPSTCFFEGTIMSEGRGTPAPFEIIGHPRYPVHTFSFTPQSIAGASTQPKFKGEICYGVDLRSVPVDSVRQMHQLWLSPLLNSFILMNEADKFFIDYFDLLAGTDQLRTAILKGKTEDEIRQSWQADLREFEVVREKYLIYKP